MKTRIFISTMKTTVLSSLLFVGTLSLPQAINPALADRDDAPGHHFSWGHERTDWDHGHSGWNHRGAGSGVMHAPEIDAAAGTSAITLLASVLLLISEKRQRSRSK